MTMVEIFGAADVAHARYYESKSVRDLILWFKAELALCPERQKKFGAHPDDVLKKHTNHVEFFARQWREARLKEQEVAVA